MDVKYDGNATQLRHYIAVDHEHEKVVLAIRGTFCASDAAVDIVGYSREFCLFLDECCHSLFVVMQTWSTMTLIFHTS